MSLSGHQSAKMKNDEWITPPEILAPLGDFTLDPCSPISRPWPTALNHFTKLDDGLSLPWVGRIWLNPPFGKKAAKWLRKMALHGDGIALVAARTETKWFFESIWGSAHAVCFLRKRPHFHYVDGRRAKFNSGAPICLVAYGEDNSAILSKSGLGKTVYLSE